MYASESWWKTILVVLPMIFFTFVLLTGGTIPIDAKKLIALILTFLFFNIMFFLMIHTGKTDRWRAPIFISYAVFLSFTFICHMFEARGSMSISQAKIIECEVPFCHIVISMAIVPAILKQSIIFPGTIVKGYASIASMCVIWIGASLALGRGFCSWGCFFGGWDDGFSRLLKKPRIKKIDFKWTYMPFAVLLLVVLTSAIWLSPTYCDWICPYKAVTEYEQVTSIKSLIQTIIFISLFVGLVIVLPILTKRRTQCSFLCPMGALQSFTNKINAFEIRIDKEKCAECKRCTRVCATFSLTDESVREGTARINCIKCGKCIDTCNKQAISYHIRGTPVSHSPWISRLLFLYPAFLFLAMFSGGQFQDGILRIINLILIGSPVGA